MALTGMRPASRRRLVIAASVLAALLGGCGDGTGRPVDVSLEDLVQQAERFEGATVSTIGTVRRFEDPLHYWIEDAVPHRVALEPHHLVEDLVGQEVLVRGRFGFVEGQGRVLQVEEVTRTGQEPEGGPAASADTFAVN